jgi:hypothetical protein
VIPTISTSAANLSNPNDPHNVVARVRRVFRSKLSPSGVTRSFTPMAWRSTRERP